MKGKLLFLIYLGIVSLTILGGCSLLPQSSVDGTKGETSTNEANTEEQEKNTSKEKKSGSEDKKDASTEVNAYDETNNVIEVSAFEMGYDPKNITLKKGVEYVLVMTNDGEVFHDLTTTELKADITFKGEMAEHPESMSMIDQIFGVQKVHADVGGHDDQSFHMNSKPGQTVKLKFIPTEVGEYEFACSIPGHKESGMVGTITVVE